MGRADTPRLYQLYTVSGFCAATVLHNVGVLGTYDTLPLCRSVAWTESRRHRVLRNYQNGTLYAFVTGRPKLHGLHRALIDAKVTIVVALCKDVLAQLLNVGGVPFRDDAVTSVVYLRQSMGRARQLRYLHSGVAVAAAAAARRVGSGERTAKSTATGAWRAGGGGGRGLAGAAAASSSSSLALLSELRGACAGGAACEKQQPR